MTEERRPFPDSEQSSDYQNFSETVGGVPNFKKKDNVIQSIVVIVFIVMGLILGWAFSEPDSRRTFGLLGGFGGLVVGTFFSGFVLMVVGWKRAAQRRK